MVGSRIPTHLYNRETGKDSGLVRTWEKAEPGPHKWTVGGLLPDGVITILYGLGGLGKTLIATSIAIAVALGISIADLPTIRGDVLYLDAELDLDEFLRRSYKLSRGLGLKCPPRGLYYFRLSRSLASPEGEAELRGLVEWLRPVLIVLDSLSIASFGLEPNEAAHMLPVLKTLQNLSTTVLAVDHVAKPQKDTGNFDRGPFGSDWFTEGFDTTDLKDAKVLLDELAK
jgi:hypothetical protein